MLTLFYKALHLCRGCITWSFQQKYDPPAERIDGRFKENILQIHQYVFNLQIFKPPTFQLQLQL